LQDALEGRFEIIVTESLDRLSRDQEDIAHIFKRINFAGGRIVTVSEGEINELHIGLKGTMGALYLKDLADKTRRGLRGRVEAGKSGGGNSYGYEVVRRVGPDAQSNGYSIAGSRSRPTHQLCMRVVRSPYWCAGRDKLGVGGLTRPLTRLGHSSSIPSPDVLAILPGRDASARDAQVPYCATAVPGL